MAFCRVCKSEVRGGALIQRPLTRLCRHTNLICVKCVATSIASAGSCPYPGCREPVPVKEKEIKEIITRFQQMAPLPSNNIPLDSIDWNAPAPLETDMMTGMNLKITLPSNNIPLDSIDWNAPAPLEIDMMTGMNLKMTVTLKHTVIAVKGLIFKETTITVKRQKLLHNHTELTDNLPDGTVARLGDHKVRANDKIMLVKIMLDLPTQNKVSVFDLFWGYPKGKFFDFLDATCLVFSGNKHEAVVDYNHVSYGDAIKHSGDIMDHTERIGHHTIDVNVNELPSNITHLFFTLSSWESENIAAFPSPTLRFYDAKKPGEDLCSTNFTHAMKSQAVIMCSLSKTRGSWQIFESGKLSDGNAKNYNPLVASIQSLIKCGV